MPKANSSSPSSKRPITGSSVLMAMPGTKKQRPRAKIAFSSPEARTKAIPARAASSKPSRRCEAITGAARREKALAALRGAGLRRPLPGAHRHDHADIGHGVDGKEQED